MTRLLMLIEGQSEEIFVKRTLTPHLSEYGVYVKPTLLWTKRTPAGGGYRGGMSNWNQISRNLSSLTHDSNAWVTTLLDFYGFPDIPGCQEILEQDSLHNKVSILQTKLALEVNHPRFIPFLALHEFEAWLFCAPEIVAAHFNHSKLVEQMQKAVAYAGEPELINHGKITHPKARLKAMTADKYKETSDGPILMEKIGIPAICDACPHFAVWLIRLEKLGQGA